MARTGHIRMHGAPSQCSQPVGMSTPSSSSFTTRMRESSGENTFSFLKLQATSQARQPVQCAGLKNSFLLILGPPRHGGKP